MTTSHSFVCLRCGDTDLYETIETRCRKCGSPIPDKIRENWVGVTLEAPADAQPEKAGPSQSCVGLMTTVFFGVAALVLFFTFVWPFIRAVLHF